VEQKKMIKQWFGTHRYVYNEFLSYTKKSEDKKEWMNFYRMRNKFVIYNNGNNQFFEGKEWMIETPKDIRADAIKSCISAHRSAFSNLRNKNITHFHVNYKSKRSPHYSISIPKSAIKYENGGFYIYKRFIKTPLKIHKRTLKKIGNYNIDHDSKLIYDGIHYYLLVPTERTTKKYIGEEKRTIALDPGVRTFQTGFSTDEVIEFSSRTDKISKLHKKIDLLKSLKDKKKKKIKRKKILKLNNKIRNIVNDVHWKTITYLKTNYTDVLLPSFDSQEMVTCTPLHSTTKRRLLGLQHYKFKKRLQEKTELNVHIVNESFTSKTCGRCGEINFGLCSSKLFKCNHCNLSIDRDFNGARNIYLKHMGERPNTLNENIKVK
jgi:putative transposase